MRFLCRSDKFNLTRPRHEREHTCWLNLHPGLLVRLFIFIQNRIYKTIHFRLFFYKKNKAQTQIFTRESSENSLEYSSHNKRNAFNWFTPSSNIPFSKPGIIIPSTWNVKSIPAVKSGRYLLSILIILKILKRFQNQRYSNWGWRRRIANKFFSMVIAAMSSFTQHAKLQACNKTTRVGWKKFRRQ